MENGRRKGIKNPNYQPESPPSSSLTSPSQSGSEVNHTVLGAVAERYESDSARQPTAAEKQWYGFLTSTLGVVSLILAIIFVVAVNGRFIEPLAEELSLTGDEVLAISEPASKMLAKAKVSKEVRDRVTGTGDGIALVAALVAYGVRVHTVLFVEGSVIHESARQNETVPTGGANGYAGARPGGLAAFGNYAAG